MMMQILVNCNWLLVPWKLRPASYADSSNFATHSLAFHMIDSNPHHQPMRWVLSSPYYRAGFLHLGTLDI